jgi:hypothetical protein
MFLRKIKPRAANTKSRPANEKANVKDRVRASAHLRLGTLPELGRKKITGLGRPDGAKVRLPLAPLARIRGAGGPPIFIRQASD